MRSNSKTPGLKWTHEEFVDVISLLTEGIVFKSKYTHDNCTMLLEYKGWLHSMPARSLKRGSKPSTRSIVNKHEYFLSRLALVRDDLELIEEFECMTCKILVKDKDGVIYLVTPTELLIGQKVTIHAAVDKNEAFAIKARKVHGDKYDYSKVEYIRATDKVEVICKEHGSFYRSLNNHVDKNSGCTTCSNINATGGWGLKDWVITGNKSNDFESYKVYVVKMYSEDEEFIKIGRTFLSVKHRFASITSKYKIKPLYIIEGDAEYVFKLESRLHKKYKDFKYLPNKDFKGYTECFLSSINLKDLDNGNIN